MAVSVLRAILDIELDLDRNIGQVWGQLCGLITDIYQYWGAKVSQMRRRTKAYYANNCPGAIIGVVCSQRPRIVAYSAYIFKALGVTLVWVYAQCTLAYLHSGRHFFGVTLFVRWPIGQRKLLNKNRTSWIKIWRRAQKLGIIIEQKQCWIYYHLLKKIKIIEHKITFTEQKYESLN